MTPAALTLVRARVRSYTDLVKSGVVPLSVPDTPRYEQFKQRYRNDPKGFVNDCVLWKTGELPSDYQNELLEQLPIKKRVAVRGPHGLGKSALASWFILWFALTRDGNDWKCPTTASAWRQLSRYLWPELHKWARRLDWAKIGRKPLNENHELLQLNLKLKTGEAFALASDNHTSIEGAHADSLLFVFDEAKAISDNIFDAAEGAFMGSSSSETYALAISTPGEPSGRFYSIHKRAAGYEDWWARHVTLEEAIAAGRIDREKAEQRKRQWGENSALYKNRVEGEFCASDEDGVIPLAWIEAANERWRAWNDNGKTLPPFTSVGVDVGGGSAKDKTVLARRFGNLVPELERNDSEDTMSTAGRTAGILMKYGGGKAFVDVIGIGAGVVSRLNELKLSVVPFNAAEASGLLDKSGELRFINKRSAAWWNMREILDPANGQDVALPPDDTLTGDLTAPHWRVTSGGKIQVESKHDGWVDKEGNKRPSIVQRLGRSTDDGDAVVMAFSVEEVEEKYSFMWAA